MEQGSQSAPRRADFYESEFMGHWQQMDRLYADYAHSAGLSYLSLTVLDLLVRSKGPHTQKAICRELFSSKQSINLIIKGFWKEGLVELREVAADRRNKEILLTRKGKAYAEKVLSPVWASEEAACACLSDEEWQSFLRVLGKYSSAFQEEIRKKSTGPCLPLKVSAASR